MNWDLKPEWVTAVATIVYTNGTFLLWRSTQKAIDGTREAFKLNFLLAIHEINLARADVDGRSYLRSPFVISSESLELIKRVFPNEFESLVDEPATTESPISKPST